MTRTVFIILCLCAVALFLPGCGKKPLQRTTPGQAAQRPLEAGASAGPMAEADAAWQNGDAARAETLYKQLLDSGTLSPDQRGLAHRRRSLAVLESGRMHLALEAFEAWREDLPDAVEDLDWQDGVLTALRGLGASPIATDKLDRLFEDPGAPWRVRSEAALALAGAQWMRDETAEALDTLEELYAAAASRDGELLPGLEAGLLRELRSLETGELEAMAALRPAPGAPYPYPVIEAETARREAEDPARWAAAWQTLRRLAASDRVANKALLRDMLASLEARRGQPSQGMALCLPLSGPYGGVGWKVLRGVGLAQWLLAQEGVDLDIRVVNTANQGSGSGSENSGDWRAELALAPPDYLVGGPLRFEVLQALHADGELDRRTFFAFLPGLGPGGVSGVNEGVDVWRFFPSARDQVRTLLGMANLELNITRFAVLHPDDTFGRRMAELFMEEARALLLDVTAVGSYPPDDIKAWTRIVADLMDYTPPRDDDPYPLPPEPPFEAVFVPDAWSRAEVLIPHFFFHGEERQVFLGASLWGQALAGIKDLETRNLRLTLFPGAFAASSQAPATVRLTEALAAEALGEPDFWVALGYDFVRFAQAVGPLPADVTPAQVTERVRSAQDMEWSMAPIAWSPEGLASQSLFMFRPSENGPVAVDPEGFRRTLERVRARHNRHVQSLKEKREAARQAPETTSP